MRKMIGKLERGDLAVFFLFFLLKKTALVSWLSFKNDPKMTLLVLWFKSLQIPQMLMSRCICFFLIYIKSFLFSFLIYFWIFCLHKSDSSGAVTQPGAEFTSLPSPPHLSVGRRYFSLQESGIHSSLCCSRFIAECLLSDTQQRANRLHRSSPSLFSVSRSAPRSESKLNRG